MECPNCKKQLADNAKSCPECGYDFSKKKNPLLGCGIGCLSLVGALIILGIIGSLFGDNEAVEKQMLKAGKSYLEEVQNEVAQDAVEQYNIAKREGDKIQVCVQAGLVSAAYLQAKDEANYQKWKAIQKADCRAAGMPY